MKDEIKVLREKKEERKKKDNENALYNLWRLVFFFQIMFSRTNEN